jgi:uncharacterized BrkB/YihY/UPF0761 family membrane protein
MNKLAHALVLLVFGIACFFLWSIITLAPHGAHGHKLPGFTIFCLALRPVMLVLPLVAAAYCLWIWFRKADRAPSWVVFFAATMSVLVLVACPIGIAAYLPLVNATNNSTANTGSEQ